MTKFNFTDGSKIAKFYDCPVAYGTDLGISDRREMIFPVELDLSEITYGDFSITSNSTILFRNEIEIAAYNRGQFQILKSGLNLVKEYFTKKEIENIVLDLTTRKRKKILSYFYNV